MFDNFTQTELNTLLDANTMVVASFSKSIYGVGNLVDYMFFDLMEYFNYRFIYIKIDIDKQPELADTLGVFQIPTVQVFYGKNVRLNLTGVLTKKEYKEVLENTLNTTKEN